MKPAYAMALAIAASVFSMQSANAAAYSMTYTATSPNSGNFSGTGDVGATLNVGDTLTVTVNAPANKAFTTGGASIFDYQFQTGGMSITEDVTYDFLLGGSSVLSGSLTNQGGCCADVRLPLYSLPALTWDTLTYTATILSEAGPAVLQNSFILNQGNTRFIDVAAVPEPASIALLGIGALGFAARRRQRGGQAPRA